MFPSEVMTYHVPPANIFVHQGGTATFFYILAFHSTENVLISTSLPTNGYHSTNQNLKVVKVFPITKDLTVFIHGFTFEAIETFPGLYPVKSLTEVSTEIKVIG